MRSTALSLIPTVLLLAACAKTETVPLAGGAYDAKFTAMGPIVSSPSVKTTKIQQDGFTFVVESSELRYHECCGQVVVAVRGEARQPFTLPDEQVVAMVGSAVSAFRNDAARANNPVECDAPVLEGAADGKTASVQCREKIEQKVRTVVFQVQTTAAVLFLLGASWQEQKGEEASRAFLSSVRPIRPVTTTTSATSTSAVSAKTLADVLTSLPSRI